MNSKDDGSQSIAARTYGFPPGWLLGGHDLAELYAVAQGVHPRLLVQTRYQGPPPLSQMTVEDLADRLADLADRAAAVVDELDKRADQIRDLTDQARQAYRAAAIRSSYSRRS